MNKYIIFMTRHYLAYSGHKKKCGWAHCAKLRPLVKKNGVPSIVRTIFTKA